MNYSKYIGKKYTELTVLEILPESDKFNRKLVNCVCNCGQLVTTALSNLAAKGVKRCRDCKNQLKAKDIKAGELGCRRLYDRYKVNAETRNLQFNVSYKLFRQLTSSNCEYCGLAPLQIAYANYAASKKKYQNRGNYLYNGMDRIDNTKGYVRNNLVACCKNCNYAKRDMNEQDFLSWITAVYNFQKGE